MIDDVLDIIRSEGRMMDGEEIRDALMWRDPVRYRTARREDVNKCICRLRTQGFIIKTEYVQDGRAQYARYKYLGVKA